MAPRKNLIGLRFNNLTVVGKPIKKGSYYWECVCDCGNTIYVRGDAIKSGNTKSCGCRKIERAANMNKTHGKAHSRLYGIWAGIKTRCYNKNEETYPLYGGRGIKMCEEWRTDYAEFEKWAIENGYDITAPRGKCTIDRIDVNGNYDPLNCRWVTQKEQSNNTRNCVYITFNGETLTMAQWSEKLGINYGTLKSRLKRGWSVDKSLTSPVGTAIMVKRAVKKN